MQDITALITFDKRKGAVFILAFFRYVKDCIITETPPNEHTAHAMAKEMGATPSFAKSFNPLVHSKNPKSNPFVQFVDKPRLVNTA